MKSKLPLSLATPLIVLVSAQAQLAPPAPNAGGRPLPPPPARSGTLPPPPVVSGTNPPPQLTPPIHRAASHHFPAVPQPVLPPQPSNPVVGLTLEQFARFQDGVDQFRNILTPQNGLGPIFNDISCVACHNAGGTGGAGGKFVTRFGKTVDGQFDPLESLGGSLLQNRAINPVLKERIPPEANTVARRITTPLFGAGLIEAIPDSAIQENQARAKADGVKGRAALVSDVASGQTRVGRFGWKAQHATLLSFAGDAGQNEMGLTNRLFPTENAPNGRYDLLAQFVDPNAAFDDQPDPLTQRSDIDRVTDFMVMLAPVPALPLSASALAGRNVFQQTGCAQCHQPSFLTGSSPVASLNHKPVPLFSDLLLHDMGKLNDGVSQADAGPNEMRTAPLWGLRLRKLYLHDGRALTVDAAIKAHDGEAAPSRDRYLKLQASDLQALLDYLNSI